MKGKPKTKPCKDMARQGDLLFVRVKKRADGVEIKPATDNILAHGELTGHAHRVATPGVSIMDYVRPPAGMLATKVLEALDQDIEIRHEEHGPILLEKGVWEVHRQREYFPEGIKQVAD